MKIRVGPILGAIDQESARVFLEWETGDSPLLEMGTGQAVSVTKTTHPSAGVFVISGLSPDTEYDYRFNPIDTDRPGPFHFRTAASSRKDGAIALVSCNSSEYRKKRPAAVEAVWYDLAEQIVPRRVLAVIHAGDQVYADKAWEKIYEEFRVWLNQELRPMSAREKWCRDKWAFWVEAYRDLYREAWTPGAISRVLSEVPNVMMWDDHDIRDGHGSRGTESWIPQARIVEVARQVYREYQDGLNPRRAASSSTLRWSLRWPGVELFALDLRSERIYDRNPSRIVGKDQWSALDSWRNQRAARAPGDDSTFGAITFLVASTPPVLFGKTDSPLYHLILDMTDDLRDQWIHGANVPELRRFLAFCDSLTREKNTRIVVLSGDIHIHHLVNVFRRSDSSLLFNQVTSSPVGNTPFGEIFGGHIQPIVYGGDLSGPTHKGSPYDGRIVSGTLLSYPGYAIIRWRWKPDDKPEVAVSWRLLGDDHKIFETLEFPLC